jgi:hypothetical protein
MNNVSGFIRSRPWTFGFHKNRLLLDYPNDCLMVKLASYLITSYCHFLEYWCLGLMIRPESFLPQKVTAWLNRGSAKWIKHRWRQNSHSVRHMLAGVSLRMWVSPWRKPCFECCLRGRGRITMVSKLRVKKSWIASPRPRDLIINNAAFG